MGSLPGLLGASQDELNELFALFGSALVVEVTSPGNETWRATDQLHHFDQLAGLVATESEDASVTARLSIDKQELIRVLRENGLLHEAPRMRWALYFGESSLTANENNFNARGFEEAFLGVEEKDEGLVPNSDDASLQILIADSDGCLRGPFLEILGRNCLEEASSAPSPPVFQRLADVRQVFSSRAWPEGPRRLTPDFLEIEPARSRGLEQLRRRLQQLQNQLIIPALANSSRLRDGQLVSRFEGESVVEVDRGETTSDEPSLFALYQWAYQDLNSFDIRGVTGDLQKTVETRLEIVRRVIASRLTPDVPTNFSTLLRRAAEILEQCKVQLKVLVNKNLAESFERMHRVQESVRAYMDKIAEKTQKLASETVDNAYRTLGLLLALAIGWVLEPTRGLGLLAAGALLFGFYLAFLRSFYFSSLAADFKATQRQFQLNRTWVEESQLIPSEELAKFVSQISDQEGFFRRKLDHVRTLYMVIAGMVLLIPIVLWCLHPSAKSSAELRVEALGRHATKIEGLDCADLRVNILGRPSPVPVVVAPTGQLLIPDLTCVATEPPGTLRVVEFVGCEQTRDPGTVERLRRLGAALTGRPFELQLLTPTACEGRPGPERLRALLSSDQDLARVMIWAH